MALRLYAVARRGLQGRYVPVKIVEDTPIPGKLPIIIPEPKGTGKTVPCDYI